MDIVEEREGDVLVLVPVGRLDTTTSRDFEKRLLELVNGGNIHYVIDFTRLDYVSSAGLRVLVMLGKRLPGLSGSLVLSSLSPQVKEVFDIAGFTRVFQIVADRKQALAETERQRLAHSGKPAKPAAKAKASPATPAKDAPAKPSTEKAAAAKPAMEKAEKAEKAAAEKPAAKPAATKAKAPATPAPAPAPPAPAQPAVEKPVAPEPAAEKAAGPPAKRSVEDLAIELLRKTEAPPFLEQQKKSK